MKTSVMKPAPEGVKFRLPPVSSAHRRAISEFLRHALGRVERALEEHRIVWHTAKDDRLSGLMQYQRHQVATIRDLIAQNGARRVKTRTARTR